MSPSTRIDDLPTAQMLEALERQGDELLIEQLEAVERFVERIGGMENARLAIEMLTKLEQAA